MFNQILTPYVLLVIDCLGCFFAISNVFLYKRVWVKLVFIWIAFFLAICAYANALKVLAS